MMRVSRTSGRRHARSHARTADPRVSGTARLRLHRGSVSVVGRKAAGSLYDPTLASFDEAGGYDQADAGGFIRLSGLRLRIRELVRRRR